MSTHARSRDLAVEKAAELFQRQGYAATGVAQVIAESGCPKGSFYFNFPGGKEELGSEALRLSGQRLQTGIEVLARRSRSPRAFLRALTAGLAQGLEHSDFGSGCPIATVALETATTSELLRTASETQFAAWEAAIARGLAADERVTARHRALAAQIMMLLEGALLMARVRRTTAPLRLLDSAFERLLEPQGAQRGSGD
jgi:TetR/AcrR family transcriptional repressor of lmrAB and yxaGH operons